MFSINALPRALFRTLNKSPVLGRTLKVQRIITNIYGNREEAIFVPRSSLLIKQFEAIKCFKRPCTDKTDIEIITVDYDLVQKADDLAKEILKLRKTKSDLLEPLCSKRIELNKTVKTIWNTAED